MSSVVDKGEETKPRAVPGPRKDSDPNILADANDSPYSRAASTARLGSPVPGQFASSSPARHNLSTPKEPTASENPSDNNKLAGLGSSPRNSAKAESALAKAFRGIYSDSSPTNNTSTVGTDVQKKPDARRDTLQSDCTGSQKSITPKNWNSPAQAGPYEDLEVVRRHLVGQNVSSSPGASGRVGVNNEPGGDTDENGLSMQTHAPSQLEEFSSLQLQGGDVTRAVYRWTERTKEEMLKKRSKSFIISRPNPDTETENVNSIRQPGGFRRDYLRRVEPSPSPNRSSNINDSQGDTADFMQQKPFTSNFIEFLSLYGHFAGEALEEDDEDLEPNEYYDSDMYDNITPGQEYNEHTALLSTGKKRRKRKERIRGKGSATGAALLLVKSFVGTGVLFLPRAFSNGGMVFSAILLLFVSLLSYYCFLLLISTRLKVDLSFGDMGLHLYNQSFKSLINFSLVISQMGFTSAYIVFVSENLRAFLLAVSKCAIDIDIKYMILIQMLIFLPLSLYRNINKIQKFALVADVFILLGILYLWYYDIFTLSAQNGVSDIVAFNGRDWTLFIGTAIFTFEGVGLILPIQEGMKYPKQFPQVLGLVMVGITAVFIISGAMSYAAFGSKTQTVVLLNMDQSDKFVNAVQFIYSIAILLSTPLQIYPAIEITSQQLFSRTGKYNPFIKWKKNLFRFFMVILCAGIAWLGANDLDKFVALVGSFACVPLVYIYPVSFYPWETHVTLTKVQPLLHYRAVSRTTFRKVADILLVIFGMFVMIYTTALTLMSWANSQPKNTLGYCNDN